MIVDPISLFTNERIPAANKCWMMTWKLCDFKPLILESLSITFFLKLLAKPSGEFHWFDNWKTFSRSLAVRVCGFINLSPFSYRCNFGLIFKACKSRLALSVYFDFPYIPTTMPNNLSHTFFSICITSRLCFSDNVDQYSIS